jgi:hypothetical protein
MVCSASVFPWCHRRSTNLNLLLHLQAGTPSAWMVQGPALPPYNDRPACCSTCLTYHMRGIDQHDARRLPAALACTPRAGFPRPSYIHAASAFMAGEPSRVHKCFFAVALARELSLCSRREASTWWCHCSGQLQVPAGQAPVAQINRGASHALPA